LSILIDVVDDDDVDDDDVDVDDWKTMRGDKSVCVVSAVVCTSACLLLLLLILVDTC
jgi:hypothetical protein